MCGRYTIGSSPEGLIEYYTLQPGYDLNFLPRYNISPTQVAATIILRGNVPLELVMSSWGLTLRLKDKPAIPSSPVVNTPTQANARLQMIVPYGERMECGDRWAGNQAFSMAIVGSQRVCWKTFGRLTA